MSGYPQASVDITHKGFSGLIDKVRRGASSAKQTRERFGTVAAAQYLVQRIVNLIVFADSWKVAVCWREDLRDGVTTIPGRFTFRLATIADLEAMQADQRLDSNETRISDYEGGALCFLSFVDGRLAGYAWARREGQAELLPGFRFSVPDQLFYDYRALTLPEFRGLGLQSYRMSQLFNDDALADKAGLFGFVRTTNFPMRQALAKSGCRTVGSLWLFGTKRRFVSHFSASARRLGMRRV